MTLHTGIMWSVNYWADRLKETEEEARPLLLKAQIDHHSTKNFTVEEQYKLISLLGAYASYSRLLKEDLTEHNDTPKPVPFWKKLFRK